MASLLAEDLEGRITGVSACGDGMPPGLGGLFGLSEDDFSFFFFFFLLLSDRCFGAVVASCGFTYSLLSNEGGGTLSASWSSGTFMVISLGMM